MGKYKVTIKKTETYTYDVDYARCREDAIVQAFQDRNYWSCEHYDEYRVTAELQELEEDE
jgi:hypothetical protein